MPTSRRPRGEDEFIEHTLRGIEDAIREARRETSRLLQAAREGRRYVARTRRRLAHVPDPSPSPPVTDATTEHWRPYDWSQGHDVEATSQRNHTVAEVITLEPIRDKCASSRQRRRVEGNKRHRSDGRHQNMKKANDPLSSHTDVAILNGEGQNVNGLVEIHRD